MMNRPIIGIALLILLSTFISQKKVTLNKFRIQEIIIENNNIIENQEIKKIFSFLYNKNIIFLNHREIKKNIDKKNFIKKIQIKKILPNKLVIKVFEKEPIAILIDKYQNKFYIGKKIDLIEYKPILKYTNLPIVKGDHKNFKILFNDLIKINFPTKQIISYRFFKVNRWDIEMIDNKIIRLPAKNYSKALLNFINIKDKSNFKNHKIFDYRLNNQLVLK